ncbi:MAG: outer membrane protein assembly factor BamA [Deltaproteobacteria bacterium]|nr:outer membrane protein assembly factor BamA [Deltaproteobacteria bacterium]MBW2085385.1 outer membrane protein assembly factor BamA [Deltaproteobacteria bacterium]
MVKRIVLFTFLLLLIPTLVQGAQKIKIGVLPFMVYGKEDLGYLQEGIQEMFNGQLLQHGIEVASKTEVRRVLGRQALADLSEQSLRKLGRALDVDYIIYGSLTKIGRSLSLDTRIVDTVGLKRTSAIFVQGEGLETLMAMVRELAVKATFKVTGREKLAKIVISGNKRIETDAIKAVVESKEGEIFSTDRISADLKRIYAMNFFEDVKVEVEDSPEGKVVHFVVVEKPSVRQITFKGTRNLKEEDLLDVLGYARYSILDTKKIVESVENIHELYREKGYYNAEATYEIENIGPKMVAIRYRIEENRRLYVKKIRFEGNENISRKKLLKFMKTKEKGLFSWLTESGRLKRDKLKEDVSKLLAYYYNHGYIKVQMADPHIEVEKDGLVLTITVSEGPQYKVGQVSLTGDLIEPEQDVSALIEIDKWPFFNREILQNDIKAITSYYTSHGYAYAVITPLIREHEDNLTIDITYKIVKKSLVYFERIEIVGNTRTRDKVIRREFKVHEGDLFSADKLRKSVMNLHRLGYFKDLKFSQSKGSTDDRMNIRVAVEEQPTGAFSIGAGYSSYNKVFGVVQVSQNNLFGKGQSLQLQASFGARITEYSISFTEPWLWDIPLSAGFDLYNQTQAYDDYNKFSTGGALRLGYPIMDYVRLSGRYKYEDATISDVSEFVSAQVKDMAGQWTTSSIGLTFRRDTRNRFFNPTSGSNNSISVEYAGGILGGTSYFSKYILNSGWFFPLPWGEHVFFARGKLGFIKALPGGKVPIFEKFYLGGMYSLRGFQWGTVGPQDPATNTMIGGDKMVLFNFEYIFPLIKDAGLMGVIFFDTGNAFLAEERMDLSSLRQSVGFGIRFYSPLGPMRLEWGYVLDPKPGEKKGLWEFSVGTFF